MAIVSDQYVVLDPDAAETTVVVEPVIADETFSEAYALPALILFASHWVKYLPAPLPKKIGLPVAGASCARAR